MSEARRKKGRYAWVGPELKAHPGRLTAMALAIVSAATVSAGARMGWSLSQSGRTIEAPAYADMPSPTPTPTVTHKKKTAKHRGTYQRRRYVTPRRVVRHTPTLTVKTSK